MAKTRLNKTHRELLKNLANSKTQEQIDIAFTAYQVMGEELQAKQFPASDMAIFKKYECAKPQTQIKVMKDYQEKLEQLKNRIATGMTTQNDVELLEQLLNNKQENK